jgi:hypothetical protein
VRAVRPDEAPGELDATEHAAQAAEDAERIEIEDFTKSEAQLRAEIEEGTADARAAMDIFATSVEKITYLTG